MASNATSWFYAEPESGRPYLIAERINHTFWTNRITGITFSCVNPAPPYRLVGTWQGQEVEIEFEVGSVFILRMAETSTRFMKGVAELLGFSPTVSYTDADGRFVVEWYAKDAAQRLKEVQSNNTLQNVKRYKSA